LLIKIVRLVRIIIIKKKINIYNASVFNSGLMTIF